jgi:hypothetical protein
VATDAGAGCVCDPGQVARSFTDLDGAPSITCVPETAPVDLAAGGIEVPDICGTLSLARSATCVNLAGFAGMRCGSGQAAVLSGSRGWQAAPDCSTIVAEGEDSGARDYTAEYESLRICAPVPPACDARYGWMVRSSQAPRDSVEECSHSTPHDSWFDVPAAPTCQSSEPSSASSGSGGVSGSGLTTQPRQRMMQNDTTAPRVTLAEGTPKRKSGDGCALIEPRARPSLLVLAWLALAGFGLLRRRSR